MNIKLLLSLIFLFVTYVHAETVYKTVDAEGNIVFSDVPSDGAEEITIKKAQAINPPKARSFKLSPAEDKPNKFNYTKLTIDNPENDATIHGGDGNVNITATLEPELNENDVIVLFMDGKEMLSGRSAQFLLANVDRGTHSISVAVKNEDDNVLKRSDKVTFHVRRTSLLSPTNNSPKPDIPNS